jgi:hypothetical protein
MKILMCGKQEKMAPEDYVILSNIAEAYRRKGDVQNAIRYFRLTIQYGDEDAKKYARDRIDELEKKQKQDP